MKCLIIANCNGVHYQQVLKKLIGYVKNLEVEYINFYGDMLKNLNIFEIYKEKIKQCDLLVVQHLMNHKIFNIENLKSITKKECIIIVIPRLLCFSFWPYDTYGISKFENEIRIPKNIKSVEDVPNFLNSCGKTDDEIKKHFDLKYNILKEVEKNVDLKFLNFFDENYKKVALFKDPNHPTDFFNKNIINMFIDVLTEKLSFLNLKLKKLSVDSDEKQVGHYEVITNDVARVLGLDFNLDSYYIVSRHDFLTKIINYQNSENEAIGYDYNKILKIIKD
jgi:hypothetical protein